MPIGRAEVVPAALDPFTMLLLLPASIPACLLLASAEALFKCPNSKLVLGEFVCENKGGDIGLDRLYGELGVYCASL